MTMFDYNTSINQGGIGGSFPAAIDKLRAPRDGGLANGLFNLSPYQRGRINPQAMSEMNSQFNDTRRAAQMNAANDLQRKFNAADQQMRMNQIGAGTNVAMNWFNTANSLNNQQRDANMNTVPWMNNMFGNFFGQGLY
jgi:hypothetical protein